MLSNRIQSTKGGLVAGLAVSMLSVGVTSAQPDQIVLAGQIRDFHDDHPDFGLTPGVGGAVTGLMEYYSTAMRPEYHGNGIEITQDALDSVGREIAPHMFANSPANTGVFVMVNPLVTAGNSVTDSYDPTLGYDPDTAIDIPALDTVGSIDPVTMPVFDPPVPKTTSMAYKTQGESGFLTGNYHTGDFSMKSSVTLVVVGDVNIIVEGDFSVLTQCHIEIPAGSSLTVWLGGSFRFEQYSDANVDDWDHSQLVFMNYGGGDMDFSNNTNLVCTIVAPESDVTFSNNTDFHGALTANSVTQDNTSGVHIAGEFAWVSECFGAGDTQQAAGNPSAGRVLSVSSFKTWFSEAPGVNAADTFQLFMTETAPGIYGFSETSWDPINDDLYGNEGGPANRNFTIEVGSIFFNENCTGNFIEVETEMDVWVFVNDTLVIDLGGTTGVARQRIDLDRLGLASNTWNTVRFFIAQRVDGPQDLRISTSLSLTPPRDIVFKMSTHHD